MPRFSSYDGTELAYTRLGEGDRPLVCLPGGPGRAVAYLEDLAGLPDVRPLLLLDPRATGYSDVPADPATLRFDRLADDLEALRLHLGLEPLDVLGHSAGSIVAQAWAAQHPERVGQLVLLTPSDVLLGGTRADLPAIRAARAGEPWYADAAEAVEALEDAPPSMRASLERATRPFFYGRWDERTQAHAATADTQSSKRAVLGFSADPAELDVAALVEGMGRVTAPVLAVGGERDALTGVESVHAVAAAFPDGRAAVVPGAGHFPWVDEPAAFRAAVDPFVTLGAS